MTTPNNCTWPGRIFFNKLVPCGPINATNPYVPCCGIGDTCLTGNICQYTHSLVGGSGYYTAGCSNGANDQGFLRQSEQQVCPNRCGDTGHPDIVYDSTAQIWKCCGATPNGTISCQDPTTENFLEPAPSNLIPYWFAGQSVTPSASASASATPVAESAAPSSTATNSNSNTKGTHSSGFLQSTPTPTPTPNSPNALRNSGLSTGAKAGIGAGVGIGVLMLAAIIFFLLRRQRRANKLQDSNPNPGDTQDFDGITYQSIAPPKQVASAELAADVEPVELPSAEMKEVHLY